MEVTTCGGFDAMTLLSFERNDGRQVQKTNGKRGRAEGGMRVSLRGAWSCFVLYENSRYFGRILEG